MPTIKQIKTPDNTTYDIHGVDDKAYHTDDTELTSASSLANSDYIPIYDTSDTASKKFKISNLVTRLKTLLGLGNAAYKDIKHTYDSSNEDAISGKGVADALSTLPEPMIFKGSLGTGGTITTLPTASSSNKGYTYKVITDGTYASQSAKVGDTFISDGTTWVLIPSGDEPSGTVTNVAIQNGNNGITVSGGPITESGTLTVSHADTSSQASSTNSGRTYIQSIGLDGYGHVTSLSTATETVTNTDTKVTQTNNTANSYLPILLANSTTSPETTTVKKNTNLTANPSNGYMDVNSLRIHSNVADHSSNFARLYCANTGDRRYKLPVDKDNDSELAVVADIPTQATDIGALPDTTKYAGSSTAGGVATSAAKLSNTSKIGDTNKPVYFTANGVPAAISYTIGTNVPSNALFTDTTYTFTGGTNKFSVSVNGGTASDVNITPSITNNVTGTGTSGYLAKFNGDHTVTNGPALGNSTTTFLTNKGTWATPVGTTYTGDGLITITNNVISTTATKNTAASATPEKVSTTGAVGTGTKYAREDHVHGIDLATGDANGQVKIAGQNVDVKGLGSNAYSSTSYLPLAGGTVTGTLILSRTQDASGTKNNKPALIVGGTDTQGHIEFDSNEIMAKSDGTTPSGLYLNSDGGVVQINSGIKFKKKTTNALYTGSGTAGSTSADATPVCTPALWTYNTGQSLEDGDVICIKIPIAGHANGVALSVDNGTTYKPVIVGNSGATLCTTHYGNGVYLILAYEANTSVSAYPAEGATAKSSIKGNWRVVNYRDTDTHYTTHLYAGASNGNANAATTNGNTYLIACDNTTARDRINIKGTGATSVTSDANGVITVNSTNTDTLVKQTEMSTANSWRSLCWASTNNATEATAQVYKSVGLSAHFQTVGVANTEGIVNLAIGNSKAKTADGNYTGRLYLYNGSGKRHTISPSASTSDVSLTLPDTSGEIPVIDSDGNLYTPNIVATENICAYESVQIGARGESGELRISNPYSETTITGSEGQLSNVNLVLPDKSGTIATKYGNSCLIGNQSSAVSSSTTWYKVATWYVSTINTDISSMIVVNNTFTNGATANQCAGLLYVHFRQSTLGTCQHANLNFVANKGFDTQQFKLVWKPDDDPSTTGYDGLICCLYTSINVRYLTRRFTFLDDGYRTNTAEVATYYDNTTREVEPTTSQGWTSGVYAS